MQSPLIQKYNVPGPRYTSYPTVPYWDEDLFQVSDWKKSVKHVFAETNSQFGISLYIHLPFCESLCTFCGCNKYITLRHENETPYLEVILKEWDLYLALFDEKPMVREIHLGGGTPTFFSPENLKKLINGILSKSKVAKGHEFSFEGHPNNTTKAHLQALYDVGFRRVSFGIQDYDPKVQKAIHRIQPFENVENVTNWAREIGYESVGHDLIYGLPFQTLRSIIKTISLTAKLRPDRIAFYSYAHVPWLKGNGQRGFDDQDIPKDNEKLKLFLAGKSLLTGLGYEEIGMDHFALPEESLSVALKNGRLHRNFMGYTTTNTKLLIGLGVSSIGDSWSAFGQNIKTLKDYMAAVNAGDFPVYRGHLLTDEDLVIRKHILNLMCRFETSWINREDSIEDIDTILDRLQDPIEDGFVNLTHGGIQITPQGRPYVRNVCMAFDKRLHNHNMDKPTFSQTI
ncbi:MAG: oxygen-independent coproporphyrinogen III oxidase [Flavobacteriales bacterium CG_4_9_14_3_um_filter_40_17]|nr:MAG: oxygen-independent coproporphyrinogen III oxidase [Flavobacteriales bacterium CG_4_9_14_3_um_filter_40_17]